MEEGRQDPIMLGLVRISTTLWLYRFGPQFITYDNKKYLNTWHDSMIDGDIRNLQLGKLVLLMIYRSLCDGTELHSNKSDEADLLYNQILTNEYNNLDFKFCIQWLAKIVQSPGCNLQTNLWFCGKQQGVGKGTLVNIMKSILGHTAVRRFESNGS